MKSLNINMQITFILEVEDNLPETFWDNAAYEVLDAITDTHKHVKDLAANVSDVSEVND